MTGPHLTQRIADAILETMGETNASLMDGLCALLGVAACAAHESGMQREIWIAIVTRAWDTAHAVDADG